MEYIKKELYQDREEIEKTVGSSILQESGTMTRKGVIQMAVRKLICLKIMGSQKRKSLRKNIWKSCFGRKNYLKKRKKMLGVRLKDF